MIYWCKCLITSWYIKCYIVSRIKHINSYRYVYIQELQILHVKVHLLHLLMPGFFCFILMTVSQMTIHSVHIAIVSTIAAIRTIHLYHGMLYSFIWKQAFDILSYGICLADLLIRDLNVPWKGGNSMPDRPYMHIVNTPHLRNSGNLGRILLLFHPARDLWF